MDREALAPPVAFARRSMTSRCSCGAACGAAPGIAALTPVRDFAGEAGRIGAGWLTSAVKDRHITWHNGGTGGFRSYVGLDLENQRGVAVVRASPRSADRVGLDLLGGQ